jgi:hypothetical protein
VWIGNRIHWTLKQPVITNNYNSLTELHTPKITVTTEHTKSCQSFLGSVFEWRMYPFLWFPKAAWPQLPATHFSQLQFAIIACSLVAVVHRAVP